MNSFIPWIGGKRLLRKTILQHFPEGKPSRYIEPFGGAGWVLFSKDNHAELEVYNDSNSQLVSLFRCAKYHTEELVKEIDSLCLNSRELFETFKEYQNANGFTDIQKAAMFYLIIRISYGADRRTFGCSKKNILDKTEFLYKVKVRLKNVVIENRDFEKVIKNYDRPKALIYLDPPYHGTEKYYDEAFNENDHVRLYNVLSTISGRFILSYNNDDFIKTLYKNYSITNVNRQNNLSNKGIVFKELIIKNY